MRAISERQITIDENGQPKPADPHLELHLSLAVYLATYAGVNDSFKSYYEQKKDVHLDTFIKYVFDEEPGYDFEFKELMEQGVGQYRAAMKRIVNGDNRT